MCGGALVGPMTSSFMEHRLSVSQLGCAKDDSFIQLAAIGTLNFAVDLDWNAYSWMSINITV